MCVLLCGVWSLKKARLRCDRLCWWPLNFNTLHNYTCIKIDKVYPSQKWWDITELLVHPASLDMGGAPPHTNHRIRQAARGEEQVGLLKNNAPVANLTLDSLEHGVTLSWRSLELGLTLGAWLSWLSLLNISGAALVTLPRHRLNQPSIRRRRIEGTTSKNNELNAYRRKESLLWRHAAASTYHVFPPESTRRRTNHPRGFRGQRPEQRIWRKQNQNPACFNNESKYL